MQTDAIALDPRTRAFSCRAMASLTDAGRPLARIVTLPLDEQGEAAA